MSSHHKHRHTGGCPWSRLFGAPEQEGSGGSGPGQSGGFSTWASGQDGPSRTRLYRSNSNRYVAGVCGGIAEYLGLQPALVRFLVVIGTLFLFHGFALLMYLGIWIFVPRRPDTLYRTEEESAFWRDVRTAPGAKLKTISYRFKDMERRLRAMEAHVTSPGYRMDRELGRNKDTD